MDFKDMRQYYQIAHRGFKLDSVIHAPWIFEGHSTPNDDIIEFSDHDEYPNIFLGNVMIYSRERNKWAIPTSGKYMHLYASKCMYKDIFADEELTFEEKLNEVQVLANRRVENFIENNYEAYRLFSTYRDSGLLIKNYTNNILWKNIK